MAIGCIVEVEKDGFRRHLDSFLPLIQTQISPEKNHGTVCTGSAGQNHKIILIIKLYSLLSVSLALEALPRGVHCKKRYINV